MYLLGEALKGRVRAAAEEAAQKSDGEVTQLIKIFQYYSLIALT